MRLALTADEVLSTTRAVRRRLDLSRPVSRDVVEECLLLAQQAPSGGNRQDWAFVVVSDPELRAGLAELYRLGAQSYFAQASGPPTVTLESARYLVDHIHEVPIHVVPCVSGRTDNGSIRMQGSRWGSILPATWSFMLAARTRGLGTCLTTFHLDYEREAAALLGIPADEMMQAGLVPVAYTKGTGFKPARREPLETMVHWDRW